MFYLIQLQMVQLLVYQFLLNLCSIYFLLQLYLNSDFKNLLINQQKNQIFKLLRKNQFFKYLFYFFCLIQVRQICLGFYLDKLFLLFLHFDDALDLLSQLLLFLSLVSFFYKYLLKIIKLTYVPFPMVLCLLKHFHLMLNLCQKILVSFNIFPTERQSLFHYYQTMNQYLKY